MRHTHRHVQNVSSKGDKATPGSLSSTERQRVNGELGKSFIYVDLSPRRGARVRNVAKQMLTVFKISVQQRFKI